MLGLRAAPQIDPNWPDWYARYYAEAYQPTPNNTPLSDVRIIVLDAETTGLNPKRDRLLSVGGLPVVANAVRMAEQFEAYVAAPADWKPGGSVIVHGILPHSARYAYVKTEQLLKQLLGFLGDAVIVGHHIGFDIEMINRALRRCGAGELQNRVIDTVNVAKRLLPAGYWAPDKDYSLDTLARRYRIPLSDRHTALGDCYITAVLWMKLCARLGEKKGRELLLEDVR